MKKVITILLCVIFLTGCGSTKGQNPKEDFEKNLSSNVVTSEIQTDCPESSDYVTTWRIKYKSDEYDIYGYIAIPNDFFNEKSSYPCVIYNRGGNGDYFALNTSLVAGMAYSLNSVVIASQYRGYGENTGKDEYGGKDVNDVLALIDICKNLDIVDNEKLYMLGSSRGGMMTYEVLRNSDDIAKACVVSGVADLFECCELRSDILALCTNLIGGTPDEMQSEYEKRSAVKWYKEINTPLLLIHSTNDKSVSFHQAEELYSLMKAAGKDITFIKRNDDIHGISDSDITSIKEWFNL